MRLFVGIGVQVAVSQRLANAARSLLPSGSTDGIRIRWTPASNMHITLSFLGQVDPGRLEQIQQGLAAIRAARLRLEMSGISVIPNAGILLASVKPTAALLTLAERISLAMQGCGIQRERRPFQPHITLARIKGQVLLQPNSGDDPSFRQVFQAGKFNLYESVTLPDGAQYHVLKAFALMRDKDC
jgi:2'-5' RNA ligase